MRSIRLISVIALTALLAAALPGAVSAQAAGHEAEDQTVKNPDDGTVIALTVFKPSGASSTNQVPVVMHSHGWGGSRETEIGGDVENLLDAGFGVVSFDQRGHGESEGQANVQDPELETEDTQAVIDRIATFNWVKHDRDAAGNPIPNDPVLGAIGGSYGGGYQTMTALDEIAETGHTRFNALAPQITWYDLPESLAPRKVVRSAWNVVLYASGAPMVPDWIHEAFAWGTATGQWPDGTLYGEQVPGAPDLDSVFHEHSPVAFAEKGIKIDVPVLLRQGISDNLFNLNQGLKIFDQAVSSEARAQSYLIGYNGGHALPNALPPGSPVAAEIGGGVDACSGDFTQLTIRFFDRVFSGQSTAGLLPARYNLTNLDGEKCLRGDHLADEKKVEVDPLGTGAMVSTAGIGAPIHLPIVEGPLTVGGIPKLSGTVTSLDLDARVFFGLAVGTTPADATVVQNNLMPLRRVLPVQDDKFEIELSGVAVEVPEGETLFLTITPVSDMFFGHGSRTPGAMLLGGLKLTLPRPGFDKPADAKGKGKGKGKGHAKCKGKGHQNHGHDCPED
jgi:pimeloyl-ACP methyl ester carboxylesterase